MDDVIEDRHAIHELPLPLLASVHLTLITAVLIFMALVPHSGSHYLCTDVASTTHWLCDKGPVSSPLSSSA
jgi:hypothetical protein